MTSIPFARAAYLRPRESAVAFAPKVVAAGGTYSLAGTRLSGMSQGSAYGDDAQASTNFPVVRITNLQTGHVFYSRTHDYSGVAVASRNIAWTKFDVPAGQEPGLSKLEVVASGVASQPVLVWVTNGWGG